MEVSTHSDASAALYMGNEPCYTLGKRLNGAKSQSGCKGKKNSAILPCHLLQLIISWINV